MGTNKIGLYNCVFLCFILWQPAQFKRKNDLPLRYNNSSPKRATISKRIFWFLNFYQFSLPSFHRFFILFLYRCTDRNGTKSIQAWKGGDFFFSAGFRWIDCTYRQEYSINFKKITRIDVVPSGTNRLLVNPL